jgi:hypothetical protein
MIEIETRGKNRPAPKNEGGLQVTTSGMSSSTKRSLAKMTEVAKSTSGIVHGNSSPGKNDVQSVNVVTPVSHTIRVGDGPAVPVTQGPTYVTPEPGAMNLNRHVPAKK